MVEVGAENRGDEHSQQGEHGKDGLSRLAHIAHITIGDQGDDRYGQQTIPQVGLLLEVGGKTGGSHDKHNDILHDGHRVAGPERVGIRCRQRQVTLQHIDGVLLEGEDSRIVEHAEQGDNPETAVAEDLANVADLEWVVLLLSLTCLCIEFLVHKEVDDSHNQGDAHQHHTEGHRA